MKKLSSCLRQPPHQALGELVCMLWFPIVFFGDLFAKCWGVLGASWGVLGASCDVWEASWGVLKTSWGRLGMSWGPLGSSCERLGMSRNPLEFEFPEKEPT